MTGELFLLGTLGVWRITHLLHAEDGPGQVMAKLRRAAGSGVLGQAMDCFHCASLWVAAPVALLVADEWPHRALLWPALSAGAIAVEAMLQRLQLPPAVRYVEDEPQQEMPHVQLREPAPEPRDGASGLERTPALGSGAPRPAASGRADA